MTTCDHDAVAVQICLSAGLSAAQANLLISRLLMQRFTADAAQGVLTGFQTVPIQPTTKMLEAAQRAWFCDPLKRTTTLWTAMLDAARKETRQGG